jgi:hypothetical protein
MLSKSAKLRASLLLLVLAMVTSVPALAGSAVIGSVAGSLNATIGGQALVPNTTIFSGDSLAVKDGAAVVALGSGSRMVLGRETVASFLRESNEVTVLLSRGNVSMYQAEDRVGLRVKVGELTILPAKGYKTLGEVAMLNGAVVVTAKEGLLRVEGNGPAVEVVKGKTLTVTAKAARAPQGGAAGGASGASTALQVGGLAASGVSAVLSGVAISRAGDAKDTAALAQTAATAATAAANEATTAAEAAQATANLAGCAVDDLAPTQVPSPYTPPSGSSCPAN